MEKKNINAIVLAGGSSSRMGQDKAMLNYRGKTFLNQLCDMLKPLVDNIIISSNNPLHEVPGCKRIGDVENDAGPLMGIYSGLAHSDSKYHLVISCDSPLLSSEFMSYLITSHHASLNLTLVKEGDQLYPLIAVYDTRCSHFIKKYLDSGKRRVLGVLEELKVQTIDLPEQFRFQVRNFNSPEDLKYLEKHV